MASYTTFDNNSPAFCLRKNDRITAITCCTKMDIYEIIFITNSLYRINTISYDSQVPFPKDH